MCAVDIFFRLFWYSAIFFSATDIIFFVRYVFTAKTFITFIYTIYVLEPTCILYTYLYKRYQNKQKRRKKTVFFARSG